MLSFGLQYDTCNFCAKRRFYLYSFFFFGQVFTELPKSASRSFATLLQFAVIIIRAVDSRWQSMSMSKLYAALVLRARKE